MTDRNYAAALWNAAEEAIRALDLSHTKLSVVGVLKIARYTTGGDIDRRRWAVEVLDAGYLGKDSPWEMHHIWADWVEVNADRFKAILRDGERACGEWLIHAHGTIYNLPHEPFVLFDIIAKKKRLTVDAVRELAHAHGFTTPHILSDGPPTCISESLNRLGHNGYHGADYTEGVVYRVERHGEVDFLAKYVRHDKVDGKYLESQTGQPPIWNIWPGAPKLW